MNTELNMTETQRQVLMHAIEHTEGRIDWFPDHIKGGARRIVIQGLCSKALIDKRSDDGYYVIADVRVALAGQPDTVTNEPQSTPASGKNSKQALVLRMLQRPEGATLAQIGEATGWQPHTIRGLMAGAFKKKLGLEITSEKNKGSDRVYRLVAASTS